MSTESSKFFADHHDALALVFKQFGVLPEKVSVVLEFGGNVYVYVGFSDAARGNTVVSLSIPLRCETSLNMRKFLMLYDASHYKRTSR
jgi:hypothetical protein